MSLTGNSAATTVNTIISDAVNAAEQVADTAAEAALDSAVPFFALPVIKEVTDFSIKEAVGYLGGKMSIALQQVGTFIVIDTQVAGEKTGISNALAALMVAEKSGNAAQIQAAIAAYQVAQSNLINSDGAAPPVT
jgi:hypothetical protein